VDRAERMALAVLCEELPALREECRHQPESVRLLLTRIEDEARARRPTLRLLDGLVGGIEAPRGLSGELPGAGAGRAHEEWFGCPDGACDRTSQAVPAGPVPRCLVLGTAMKRR
jgi:hypothetical protein